MPAPTAANAACGCAQNVASSCPGARVASTSSQAQLCAGPFFPSCPLWVPRAERRRLVGKQKVSDYVPPPSKRRVVRSHKDDVKLVSWTQDEHSLIDEASDWHQQVRIQKRLLRNRTAQGLDLQQRKQLVITYNDKTHEAGYHLLHVPSRIDDEHRCVREDCLMTAANGWRGFKDFTKTCCLGNPYSASSKVSLLHVSFRRNCVHGL